MVYRIKDVWGIDTLKMRIVDKQNLQGFRPQHLSMKNPLIVL